MKVPKYLSPMYVFYHIMHILLNDYEKQAKQSKNKLEILIDVKYVKVEREKRVFKSFILKG